MMKKSIVFLGFILALLNNKKSNAIERIQYSLPDATGLTADGNNSMSWTFSSKMPRNPNALTAADPLSYAEQHDSPWINPDTGYEQWKDGNGNVTEDSCRNFCNNNRRSLDDLKNDKNARCHDGWNAGMIVACSWEEDGLYYYNHMNENTPLSSVSGNKCYCQYACYTADTPITLADGTIKRADEIGYDDELLVWNFDEGKFAKSKPLWIKIAQTATEYNFLKFSDDSVLKTISQHRIFNREAGKFTYPMTDETPLGTHTLNAKGEWVTLVEKRVVKENVTYHNIITEQHINCFAGNILTSCRLNNIYPIKELKFVKDTRKLVPFSEYSSLERKWYDGLRLAEQPQKINRGNDIIHANSVVDYVKNLINLQKKG